MTNDKSAAVPPWPFFVPPALEVLEEHNLGGLSAISLKQDGQSAPQKASIP